MILLRDKNLSVLQGDYIRLYIEEDEEKVIYVSRQIYDQAVILMDRFEGDFSILSERLQIGDNQALAVEYFIEAAPEPLNMLAPFLAFVEEKLELPCELEILCGALHQMSTVINFEKIVKVPKEVRANVDFTKRFILDYKESWNTLEQPLLLTDINIDEIKLNALEDVLNKVLSIMPVHSVSNLVVSNTSVESDNFVSEEEDNTEEEEEIPDFFAELLADIKAEETKEEEEQKRPEERQPVQNIVEESKYEETEEDKIAQLINKYGGA